MSWNSIEAYVRPPSGDTGKMTPVSGDQEMTYRLGDEDLTPIQEGFYEVKFTISRYQRRGEMTKSRYLQQLRPTIPTTNEAVIELVRAVTKRASDILEPLDLSTMRSDEILDQIVDEGYLRGIRGIGKKTAPKLAEKFENLRPDDVDLNRIFQHYGIPFKPWNKRAEWAKFYFQEYPGDKARFEQNPYFLLRVSDPSLSKVRRLLAIKNDEELTRAGYDLDTVDEAVLESDGRWKSHASRVKAYLADAFEEVKSDGHTVTTLSHLRQCLSRIGIDNVRFGLDDRPRQIGTDLLEKLVREQRDLRIIQYQRPKGTFQEGVTTARHVTWSQTIQRAVERLNAVEKPFADPLEEKMQEEARDAVPFELTDEQKYGVDRTYGSSLSMLTGPAGSGKTSTIQAMVSGFLHARRKHKYKDPMENEPTKTRPYSLFLLASTGAAAKRLKEGLDLTDPETGLRPQVQSVDHELIAAAGDQGVLQTGTLHSFLGYRGVGVGYSLPPTSDCVIIVDESSMLDEEPVYQLSRYLNECLDDNKKVCVLMAGDINQLPPVGAGFPFRDLLGAEGASAAPTTNLKKIHRQGEESMIIHAADQVKKKKVPPTQKNFRDWNTNMFEEEYWAFPPDGRPIETLLEDYTGLLKQHVDPSATTEDVQIITPLRNPSAIDDDAYFVRGINDSLQDYYAERFGRNVRELLAANPQNPSMTWIDEFAEGDRVVHSGQNGYRADRLPDGINRGSIGRIESITEDDRIFVRYPWLESTVGYEEPTEIGQLNLSYAVTTHAAQGNEFKHVLAPIPTKGAPTLIDQGWLYTTLTRASDHLCLVFPPSRLASDVQENYGMQRQTVLLRDVNSI